MTEPQLRLLCLTRRDPGRNMARFYRLEIAVDLFGGVTFSRGWGRIGGRGREMRRWFATPEAAEAEMLRWIERKKRRGYR